MDDETILARGGDERDIKEYAKQNGADRSELETLQQQARERIRENWSFSGDQQHTHTWHDREDFIENELPNLIASAYHAGQERAAKYIGENLPVNEHGELNVTATNRVLQEARNAE